MISKTNFRMGIFLLILKFLYIAACVLMLPDEWLIWDFGKNVNMAYLLIELVPFFLCLILLMMNYIEKNVYSLAALLLFSFYFIPANSSMALSGVDFWYFLQINVFSMLMIYLLLKAGRKEHLDILSDEFSFGENNGNRKRKILIRVLMIFISFVCLIYVYQYNGINIQGLFMDMYATRTEFGTVMTESEGTLFAYFVMIIRSLCMALLPIYLLFSIKNKKMIDIILCLFTYLALYTVTMEKSTLMIIAVVFFIAIMSKKNRKHDLGWYFLIAFVIMFGISLIEYVCYKESVLFSVLIRREFYMPQYMTRTHYDFFNESSKMWFSKDIFIIQNIVSRIFGSAYKHGATLIISENCYRSLVPSPNSGGFSEAFSQIGALGTIVFPFIYYTIFRILRKWSGWYGKEASEIMMFRLVLMFQSVHMLASSEMIGFILFVAITWFLRNLVKRKDKLGYNKL